MIVSLSETSPDTILLRRAQRLRRLTSPFDIKSSSEIRQAERTARKVAFDALIKPWVINAVYPPLNIACMIHILTVNSVPLVYRDIHGFDLNNSA